VLLVRAAPPPPPSDESNSSSSSSSSACFTVAPVRLPDWHAMIKMPSLLLDSQRAVQQSGGNNVFVSWVALGKDRSNQGWHRNIKQYICIDIYVGMIVDGRRKALL
jgi:hypothetical protein